MSYSLSPIVAVVALGCTTVRGFNGVSLKFPPMVPTPVEGTDVVHFAGHHGLAPAWLDDIPKYVCDHAEVSVRLTKPSEFGPRWLWVDAANYSGAVAQGTCLIDTRRGPRVIRYVLTPAAQGSSEQ